MGSVSGPDLWSTRVTVLSNHRHILHSTISQHVAISSCFFLDKWLYWTRSHLPLHPPFLCQEAHSKEFGSAWYRYNSYYNLSYVFWYLNPKSFRFSLRATSLLVKLPYNWLKTWRNLHAIPISNHLLPLHWRPGIQQSRCDEYALTSQISFSQEIAQRQRGALAAFVSSQQVGAKPQVTLWF